MTRQDIIAIPSDPPGGLDASRAEQLGRCAVFTLVECRGRDIVGARVVRNAGHEAGGCMVPVRTLQREGVTLVTAGSMGQRSLLGFQEAGIEVVPARGKTVREAAVWALTVCGRAAASDRMRRDQ